MPRHMSRMGMSSLPGMDRFSGISSLGGAFGSSQRKMGKPMQYMGRKASAGRNHPASAQAGIQAITAYWAANCAALVTT